MKCEYCGKECDVVRVTGKYCSAKCRQAAYRNRSTVTDVTVKLSKSVTPTGLGSSDVGAMLALHKAIHRDLNPLGLADSEMQHVAGARPGHTINTGLYKTAGELADGEFNRVSLLGDADYKE